MGSHLYRTALALVTLLAAAAPADAQLYSWRDAAGHVVISDRQGHPGARTYAVSGSAQFRSTRPTPPGRAGRFDALIAEQATLQGVSADLVRAVIQAESAFNPRARSVKGAMGLMQLMPATAAELGVTNPYDPEQNVRAGVRYLKQLLAQYDSIELALAAYNAGPGAVAKYGTVPPYRETREYVRKVKKSAGEGAAVPTAPPTRLYRFVETVDGRDITRYSDVPAPGAVPVSR